ncbi:MAG TPA: DEAD/DEAH box helicase [Ktedonobacterales bacterium]
MTSEDTGHEANPGASQEAPHAAGLAEPAAADALAEFAALGLGSKALSALTDLGFGAPTPIQRQTIPLLLAGQDIIAQAPTGTGKTAAYGLPIIERLDASVYVPQALIVTPTRELTIQVAEAMNALGKYHELIATPIYGGAPYERQLRALARGVQIVVGTPGRLLDHIRRKTLDLANLRVIVLDEADEMLNMGFIEDIEAILAETPPERQTALFSATIAPRIARLAEQFMRDPERVVAHAPESIGPRVRQVYYETLPSGKLEALARILDIEEPESAIIFVRTRRDADTLSEQLTALGYLAQGIHGEIPQSQRELILNRFRAGHTQLLVATDVAARGLDIPDVSHVINYDLPLEPDAYVHRIGRTGRAGRSGEALALVTPRDRRLLRVIEQATHRRLQPLALPTVADVAARRRAAFREDVLKLLDDGQLDPFLALVEDLSGTHNPAELAAAAFKMAAQARDARRPGIAAAWERQPDEETPPAAPEETPAPRRVRLKSERLAERDARRAAKAAAGEPSGEREQREVRRTRQRAEPREEPPMPREERRGAGRREVRRDERREEPYSTPARTRSGGRSSQRNARVFLRVGRRDGVRPADLVGAIANEAEVPGHIIGDIDIYDTFSFVEVPEYAAHDIIAALNQTTVNGRRPQAKLADPGTEWMARPRERERPRGRRER